MKKFLTVLLALSVVFTYTVGTAFALPSDGTDQAGLSTAKAEAVAELDSYLDDINDYTEVGQKLLEAEVFKGKTAVNDAKTIAEVSTALTNAKTAIQKLGMDGYLKKAVEKAIADAETQIKDYLSLFGQKVNDAMQLNGFEPTGNKSLDSLGWTDKDLNAYVADYNKALATIEASLSVEEAAKSLDKMLVVIDKYMNKLAKVEITDAQRKALVDEIITFAGKVTTADYSATIVAKYDTMVKEAVAAAKAVTTLEEYYNVIDKYLGSLYNGNVKPVARETGVAIYPSPSNDGWVAVLDGAVYICEKTNGELNNLKNMKKDVEAQIKAAKKVQSALGDYSYKDIAEGQWSKAEAYRLGLAEFIESGDAVDMPADLKAIITKVTAAFKASEVTAVVNEALTLYDGYTRLAAYKAEAITKIKANYGYEYDGTEAVLTDYDADTKAQLENLQELYTNYVNAAATMTAVDSYVDGYDAKADAYKTTKEDKLAKEADSVNATIDVVVEESLGTATLNADQKALLDRIVADLKASVKSGENFPFEKWVETGSADYKKDVITEDMAVIFGSNVADQYAIDAIVADIIANVKTFDKAKLYGYTIAIAATDSNYPYAAYNSTNYGLEIKDIEKYQGYLAAEANAATSWSGYLAQYDKYVSLCDAVETQNAKDYKTVVAAAEAAITALGSVENTKAFEAKLAAAKKAIDKAEALEAKLTVEEKSAIAGISNKASYDEAVYELAYLKYLASLDEEATTIPVVKAFYEIARGITNPSVMKLYAKADQNKILEIVTEARDAIDAATTDDSKVGIAEKAISELKDIYVLADGTDYAEALAANKAEAVKYFDKYYNADFASEAATATALIKDIIAFNEQFSDSAAAEKAQKIADTKALKIVTSTKLYTKSNKIRVNWRIREGNTASIDGYQVYKSTKAQTGYKFMGKTTKNYMDNKKNLKKGQRFYYKVRAYVDVDGQRYYSDWSNKGNRIYR